MAIVLHNRFHNPHLGLSAMASLTENLGEDDRRKDDRRCKKFDDIMINYLISIFLILTILDTNALLPAGTSNPPRSMSKLEFLPNLKSINVMTPSILAENIVDLLENALFDVREANLYEVENIVNVRMSVFFPELINEKKFQSTIRDKIIERKINGAMVLVATIRHDNQFFRMMDLPLNFSRDQLIGTVEISPNDFKNTSMEDIGAKKKLYLADLAVVNSARRLGVATKLLQKVESIALKNKYQEIYLHVEKTNDIAQKLYMKNGYQELSTTCHITSFTETRLSNSPGEYVMYGKQLGGT